MKEIDHNIVNKLRQNLTDAEKCLWSFLRAKRLKGFKFRRQHLIPPFIVDFICLQKKLIIELDGGQHMVQKVYDNKRTAFLESKGYKILRFWNNDVLKETHTVLQIILKELK